MYRYLAIACFLLLSVSLNAQRRFSPISSSDLFEEKARRQHANGWMLLGSGVLVGTVGASWAIADISYVRHTQIMAEANQVKSTEKENVTPKILTGTGLVLMAASIPFFISEKINFRKSATLSFMPAPTLLPSGRWVQYQQQGISLRLPFPSAE
jgi:hypothetical protein